ncbi:carbonic anhydrase [Gloeophyllum trabeum ATCC 11539]|uniref:Carbonic anhydrase n=1 Tax=Gloeophyllum trabeum (strain ATCC 11539 / FP-39264 / Madison 617) TaxID=670483 RepID=S7PSA8_GLOTA|nr:carbonic anhydrase [Gloeophyllum trabeum ATCC 11539]EPQ50288.1 carbonic anhydrase [Gloeophyllum trabeum ATCC 11539]
MPPPATATASQFPVLARLLSANAQWAEDVARAEPRFFDECAGGQVPKILWIGCADSRVPESVVTASKPGEIFVHRNIANQFHLDDDNAQAVLTYAVAELGVEHVLIVGHTKCGGAAACTAAAAAAAATPVPSLPPSASINRWLAPLAALAAKLAPGEDLVAASVRAQVANVCATDTVRGAWAQGRKVYVHGFVYEIERGVLRDLGVSRGPE